MNASARGPLKRTEKNKRTRKKTVSKHKTHLLILKHKIRTEHIGCWGSRQTKQTRACLLHPRELSLMKRRFTAFNTWFWSMATNFAFEYRHCSLLIVDQDLDTLTLMSCSRLSWSQQHYVFILNSMFVPMFIPLKCNSRNYKRKHISNGYSFRQDIALGRKLCRK